MNKGVYECLCNEGYFGNGYDYCDNKTTSSTETITVNSNNGTLISKNGLEFIYTSTGGEQSFTSGLNDSFTDYLTEHIMLFNSSNITPMLKKMTTQSMTTSQLSVSICTSNKCGKNALCYEYLNVSFCICHPGFMGDGHNCNGKYVL